MESLPEEDFKKIMDEYIKKSEVIPLQVDEHYNSGAEYLVENGFWHVHFQTLETPEGLKHHGVFVKREFVFTGLKPLIQNVIDLTLDAVFARFNDINAQLERTKDRQSKRKKKKKELGKRK